MSQLLNLNRFGGWLFLFYLEVKTLQDLIKSYQDAITALRKRREELQRKVGRTRGDEYLRTTKRIHALYEEEQDTLYALQEIVRSTRQC